MLNRDDRLLLHNTSGQDVVIRGYNGEPYARVLADGTVQVNRRSPARYLNDDRFAKVSVPAGIDGKGAPRWEEISRTGRFEWHDHRFHWMAETVPPAVRDQDVRTKVFDWRIPIEVGGRDGAIAGTLFWTPPPGRRAAAGRRRRARGAALRGVPPRVPRAPPAASAGRGVVIRALVLAAVLALAAPAAASAHAVLEGTAPERGATLDEPPREVVLRFSEPVEIAFGAVRVYDARGRDVGAGAAAHPRGDDRSVAVPLRPQLPEGGYTVTFRVVSADSHPVSGGFVFSVGARGPAGAASVSDLLGERRAGRATGVAFAATRALQYAAIALAIGSVAVLLLVWLPALAAEAGPGGDWRAASDAFARRWRGLMITAGVVGVASAAAALPLQAATAAGTSVWSALPETRAVLDTRFGVVWALGGLAWLALLALTATRAGAVPALRSATVGAAGVALARTGPRLAALAVPLSGSRASRRSAGTRACRNRLPCCCRRTCCTSSRRARGSAASPCC